jgi:hypothetical protein
MQSEFLQKVGLVLVCAWEMEWRGGTSGVATSLCILSEECLRYCLTICWFFSLGDCHATNMPNCSSCTCPPKILLEHHEQEGLGNPGYLWLVVSMCALSTLSCSLLVFQVQFEWKNSKSSKKWTSNIHRDGTWYQPCYPPHSSILVMKSLPLYGGWLCRCFLVVTTCVCLWFQYQQFIGGAVMWQLQDGFACVNLCSRGVCVSKTPHACNPHINAVLVYIPEQNKRRVCKYERNTEDTFALAVVQTNCLSLVAVTLKGFFKHSNVSPSHHNLADTYRVKYLTASLQCYIELSGHIDSLKQNLTTIELQNWNPIAYGKGNCRLCCCNQVLHLCSQTSFDMDGQETWIFCGSSRDSYLFLQLQWVSNAVLGCSGATMAALSLSVISPFVQYLIHILRVLWSMNSCYHGCAAAVIYPSKNRVVYGLTIWFCGQWQGWSVGKRKQNWQACLGLVCW